MEKTFLLCGQTDSGKSTFAGHVLYLCGGFYDGNIDHDARKCKYSELVDTASGVLEHNKTKTVNHTDIDFVFNGKKYKLIDTPGHQIYIRQLAEGLFTFPLNAICLVISSIPKEFYAGFERGTVKEDMLLARSTGCPNLIVLFNKVDLDPPTDEMIELVTSYAKKLRYLQVKVLKISAFSDKNFDSFFECLDGLPEVKRSKLENVTGTKCKANMSFHTSEFITAGYRCNLHSPFGEHQIEIEKLIKNDSPQVMVKGSDPYCIEINFLNKTDYCIGAMIVLRSDTSTIGFGKIIG